MSPWGGRQFGECDHGSGHHRLKGKDIGALPARSVLDEISTE